MVRRFLVVAVLVLSGCSLYFSEADDEPPCVCCFEGASAHCSPVDAPPIDTGLPDGCGGPGSRSACTPSSCNPLSPPGQQGCAAGQKCTWITVQEDPSLGITSCVPDGTVPIGGACTAGPPGETTGFDNCTAGNVCVSGTCQDICGWDGSAAAACAAGSTCTRYAGLFVNGDDDPAFGACAPTCDPLTGLITGGGSCGTGQGCYLLVSSTETVAVCAGAGTLGHNETITGPAFANSCLPGHQPRRASQASPTVECGALCRPADVTSTTNMASEGGVSPFTCEARGAAPPSSTTAGESCRYWWAREPFDSLSPYSNTIGWCFEHAVFQYDSNGDMTPDAPFPRCTTLTHGDVVPPIGNPPHDDAVFFWCSPLPASLQGTLVSTPAPVTHYDRIAGWR